MMKTLLFLVTLALVAGCSPGPRPTCLFSLGEMVQSKLDPQLKGQVVNVRRFPDAPICHYDVRFLASQAIVGTRWRVEEKPLSLTTWMAEYELELSP